MTTNKLERLGARVRRLLLERGIAQAALAELTRASRSQLSRMIAGRRRWTPHHIEAVARALDMTPEDLVAGTDAADILRANGATVEREYAEQLAGELAAVTARLQGAEAELAALLKERDDSEQAKQALAADLEKARLQANTAAAREREAVRQAELTAVDVGKLRQQNATLQREVISLRGVAAAMDENITSANQQIVANYDAWQQAEAERSRLARLLGAASSSATGAALFSGLVGLGIGVGLGSASRR